MKAPKFQNRWLIKGTFTTLSELHIGDGGTGCIHDRKRPATNDEPTVATVCVDHQGRAYIPGSSIKGPLRALVATADQGTLDRRISRDWEALFGSDDPKAANAQGGKLEFWDAFHCGGDGQDSEAFICDPQNKEQLSTDLKRPWWDKDRKTCVAVSVSLDRRTRTARENLLYHIEYVPAGETFEFEISGDNLSEDEVVQLLALLDQFFDGKVRLGAQISNGWGRVQCEVKEIRRLVSSDLQEWKSQPQPGLAACRPVDNATGDNLELLKRRWKQQLRSGTAQVCPASILVIDLRLTFESPWLVRDARQRERSEAARRLKNEGKLEEVDKPPDAIPIEDEHGKPFVPAKGLRGALRSRAEMILRTLQFSNVPEHPSNKENLVSSKRKETGTAVDELKAKDLASRLFGLSGWRAPLHIPRLQLDDAKPRPKDHVQEFVAVDRFTGGAAGGLKFNANLARETKLTGTLTVDLERLKLVDPELASVGLLALVLRDLAEGDVSIGSGSAKGQGLCTADATVKENGREFRALQDWFRDSELLRRALFAFRSLIRQPLTQQNHA